MKLGGFSTILESMMTDTMNVFRYAHASATNGSTNTTLPSTPTIANAPCRISFISEESPKDAAVDSTPVMTTPKLFFKASAVLLVGDYVIVTRKTDAGDVLAVYEGQIGLPAKYVTHQEVLFVVQGSA